MVLFTAPKMEVNGVERLGNGAYQTEFEVYTIDVHSSELSQKPIKKVPSDESYRKAATDYARTLPSFHKSTSVKTSDGVPIIYFIKQGMVFPWGSLGTSLARFFLVAIRALLASYPLPRESTTSNKRLDLKVVKEEIASSKAGGRPFGVYVGHRIVNLAGSQLILKQNWSYWISRNQHGPPMVSGDAKPKPLSQQKALTTFFNDTIMEHYCISMWLKTLDPESHPLYNKCYKNHRATGNLGVLDDGDWGTQLGHTFLANATVNPHKDGGDVKQGWTFTNVWGDFTQGGEAVLPGLGLKFVQQPGDLLMFPASVIEHMILPHEGGDRFSNVRSTKQNIFDASIPRFFCNIGRCEGKYVNMSGLTKHWDQTNGPYHEAARQRKKAGKEVDSDSATERRDDGFQFEVDAYFKGGQYNKADDDPLALPVGAPTDTRERHWCDVTGCRCSKARGHKGYTTTGTLIGHKRKHHPVSEKELRDEDGQ